MKSKAILSISGLAHPEAVHQAQLVCTNIGTHLLFQHDWAPQLVNLNDLGTSIANTRDAMVGAATRDTVKLAFLNTCRSVLDTNYYFVGRYAEIVTRHDPSIMGVLGYPMATGPGGKSTVILVAPANPSVKHGPDHSIIGRVDKTVGARSFEGQSTTGDTRLESSWSASIPFGSWHDMVFPNLIPGQLYAFRFRAIFKSGPGPWSLIVTLMAI